MEKRIKNIYFILGLVGVIFAAAGVDFESLTNWKLLFGAVVGIINNPVAIMSVAFAILGVFVDPTTPGVKDTNKDEIVIKRIDPTNTTEFRD